MEKLAHAGENLLGQLRDGKLSANPPIITALLQLLDALRSILKAIETDANEGDGSDAGIIATLDALQVPAHEESAQRNYGSGQGARFAIAGTASDGESALRLIEELRPDVICSTSRCR